MLRFLCNFAGRITCRLWWYNCFCRSWSCRSCCNLRLQDRWTDVDKAFMGMYILWFRAVARIFIRLWYPFPPLLLPPSFLFSSPLHLRPFPSLTSPSSFPLPYPMIQLRGLGKTCKLPEWSLADNDFWLIYSITSSTWQQPFRLDI